MSDKLNIFINIEDLTVVGDEFRYKYSLEDIDYMIETLTAEKVKNTETLEKVQIRLDSLTTSIAEATSNITMLGQVKEQIEG